MTKADRIRSLYAAGMSVRDIADAVGCSTEYVRVSARQRKDGKASVADLNYVPVPWDDTSRDIACAASRKAFAEARKSGLSVRQSNIVSLRARRLSLKAHARAYRTSVQNALTGARESSTNQYSRE